MPSSPLPRGNAGAGKSVREPKVGGHDGDVGRKLPAWGPCRVFDSTFRKNSRSRCRMDLHSKHSERAQCVGGGCGRTRVFMLKFVVFALSPYRNPVPQYMALIFLLFLLLTSFPFFFSNLNFYFVFRGKRMQNMNKSWQHFPFVS